VPKGEIPIQGKGDYGTGIVAKREEKRKWKRKEKRN